MADVLQGGQQSWAVLKSLETDCLVLQAVRNSAKLECMDESLKLMHIEVALKAMAKTITKSNRNVESFQSCERQL